MIFKISYTRQGLGLRIFSVKIPLKLITARSRPTEGRSEETYMLNIFLASQFKVKDLDLEYFLSRSPDFKETEFNLFLASPFKVKVKDLDLEYFL